MAHTIISTDQAPSAIGPYNQAVKAGSMVFLSGQIPLDAQSGELVGGDVVAQTHKVFENLKAVIAAAGGSLADVVKTTVYLKDMNEFVAMNEVYASYFTGDAPARATVEVARLPKDVRVEIDAILVLG